MQLQNSLWNPVLRQQITGDGWNDEALQHEELLRIKRDPHSHQIIHSYIAGGYVIKLVVRFLHSQESIHCEIRIM